MKTLRERAAQVEDRMGDGARSLQEEIERVLRELVEDIANFHKCVRPQWGNCFKKPLEERCPACLNCEAIRRAFLQDDRTRDVVLEAIRNFSSSSGKDLSTTIAEALRKENCLREGA
jgi:hypothetical protein